VGSICRFDFCYLHQNRFPGRSLCYIEGIVFVVVSAAVALIAALVASDDPSVPDNHAAH
jgi:hypothetical protein